MRQIALDTETTGLRTSDGHRVIEIGCVELINRRITGKTFHTYINPRRDIEEEAQAVHGITAESLADKPYFEDITADFVAFIQDAELIIHNAPFDVGFLEHEFKLANVNPSRIRAYAKVIDTLKLAREMHPGQRNNLDALCKRYHINNTHREWHGALLDSELLSQVYLMMTGGQNTLFGGSKDTTKQLNQGLDKKDTTTFGKTRIICANEEETKLHREFMETLIKEES